MLDELEMSEIRTFDIYKLPEDSPYELTQIIRAEVICDDDSYLAYFADGEHFQGYANGKTPQEAIKNLLKYLCEDFKDYKDNKIQINSIIRKYEYLDNYLSVKKD